MSLSIRYRSRLPLASETCAPAVPFMPSRGTYDDWNGIWCSTITHPVDKLSSPHLAFLVSTYLNTATLFIPNLVNNYSSRLKNLVPNQAYANINLEEPSCAGSQGRIVMEMEMGMDYLPFYQHLHQNPPPSPSSGYYYYCPPYATAAAMANTNSRNVDLSLPPALTSQRERAAVSRKYHHRKISTAGGMRDRRMRLSLDVARRFFSLQDKLGFDKASKTVQWLLDMSTAGINHLTASMSMSEEDGLGSVLLDSSDHGMVDCKMPTKARTRAGGKSNICARVLPDKESRSRARLRARQRTMQRNRLRSSASVIAEQAPAPAAGQVTLPVAPSSGSSSSSFGSYYEEQEPWELGGVVFAKPRLH